MARRTVLSKTQTVDLSDAAVENRTVTTSFTTNNGEEWWLSYISFNFSSTQSRDITIYVYDVNNSQTYFLSEYTGDTSTGFSFSTQAEIPVPREFEVRVVFSQTSGACQAEVLIVGYSER